jgi:hypothetical protein
VCRRRPGPGRDHPQRSRFLTARARNLEAGKKFTTAYIDGVEKYGAELVQSERKLAAQPPIDVFAGLLETQARLTEDVVKVSVSVAR